MRAIRITGVNELGIAEVSEPNAGNDEVVVELKAAALNHRDVWIKSGQYAGLKYPCIPGSDGAGVVASRAPAAWAGKEVIINPSFGWGANERTQGDAFSILGLPRDGTLAERVAVPISQLTMKPLHLSWEQAAALPLAGLTAWRALVSRGQIARGERILVNGIGGGVALFALQFALAQGGKVWVTSSSQDKIDSAVTFGAEGGFLYTINGWSQGALKKAGPFDLIIDSAGGEGFNDLIDLAGPGARIVFYGATRGNPSGVALRKIFWRQISLLGTTMGSSADWTAMTNFVSTHKIVPVVSEVVPLAKAELAFALMERGGQFGKIVVKTD